MNKKGQLFLIEVIIALTVLIILVTALFTTQTYTPPPSDTNLRDRGRNAIQTMNQDGTLQDYLVDANYSYYIEQNRILNRLNDSKVAVINSIDSALPAIASFKAITERYNDTSGEWEEIDQVNFENSLPRGTDIYTVEHYTPGINGTFAQFKFTLFLWYEVGV